MNTAGLSTDQAPPIEAPFRFFFTVPIFGLIASCILIFGDPMQLLVAHSWLSVSLLHAVTLGMIAMAMLGALMQMLPVLAGAKIANALSLAKRVHIGLILGIVAMVGGLLVEQTYLLTVGALFLALSMLDFFSAIARPLFIQAIPSVTVTSMRYAALFGLVSIILGLGLFLSLSGTLTWYHTWLVALHGFLALLGFAAFLIIGVANQIIPMFYVTPHYPKTCRRTFGHYFMVALIAAGVSLYFSSWLGVIPALAGLFAFDVVTLRLFYKKKRPVADVSFYYWISGLAALLGVIALGTGYLFSENRLFLSLSVTLLLAGWLLSTITGMLYKIVPFLVWFHLSNRGYFNVPMLGAMIPSKLLHLQFGLHWIAVILVMLNWFVPIAMASGVFFALSNFLLFYNLWQALQIYRTTLLKEPDFQMSHFS